ncbi:hypothetical protein C0J52_15873 [Blattella germanica]|nr:hypothetical protein C0J52_15873 [Blattella germanica]
MSTRGMRFTCSGKLTIIEEHGNHASARKAASEAGERKNDTKCLHHTVFQKSQTWEIFCREHKLASSERSRSDINYGNLNSLHKARPRFQFNCYERKKYK